jgi:hypothetical protein
MAARAMKLNLIGSRPPSSVARRGHSFSLSFSTGLGRKRASTDTGTFLLTTGGVAKDER